MNISTKEKQTQGHRIDLWLPYGRGLGAGKDWEIGISRYKLSYIGKKPKPTIEAGRSVKRPVPSST